MPFPSQHALGVNCANGYDKMYRWAHSSYAIFPTIGLGYASWFVLLAGVITLLRVSGRGRSGWEIFGVVAVAFTPVVWMPLLDDYHPQDLVALGLILAAIACIGHGRWFLAGLLLGLAVTSQQFTLLVLAPLFVVAPGRELEVSRVFCPRRRADFAPNGHRHFGQGTSCRGFRDGRFLNLRRHRPLGTATAQPSARVRFACVADTGCHGNGLVGSSTTWRSGARADPSHLAPCDLPEPETRLRRRHLRVRIHGTCRHAHNPSRPFGDMFGGILSPGYSW